MKKLILFSVILCFVNTVFAQNNSGKENAEFARNPVWIAMLEDTSANYFVVEEAFKTYFKHHELPEGENEVIGEHELRRKLSKRKQRKIWKENALRMDVKRYEIWHRQMEPYVQPDGRILTPTERLAIWKSQQSDK